MLKMIWSNGNSYTTGWSKFGTAIMENNFVKELKNPIFYDQAIPLLGTCTSEKLMHVCTRTLYRKGYRIIISNSPLTVKCINYSIFSQWNSA